MGNEDPGELSDDKEQKIEDKPKSNRLGLAGLFSKGLKCFDDLSPRKLICPDVENQ